MDELEKLIKNHREELEIYSPDEKTWKRIKSGLRKGPNPLTLFLSAAAIIIIVIGISSLFKMTRDRSPENKRYEAFIKNNPQIRETELYYDNLINDLLTEATPLLMDHPDLERELLVDLSQLDSICFEIKKDLKDNISNQEVIEALINNYRIRIRILNEMLGILRQEDNNIKTRNHAL